MWSIWLKVTVGFGFMHFIHTQNFLANVCWAWYCSVGELTPKKVGKVLAVVSTQMIGMIQ